MAEEQIEKIAEGAAPVPDAVLAQVLRGAAALATLTVGLLLIAWLAIASRFLGT